MRRARATRKTWTIEQKREGIEQKRGEIKHWILIFMFLTFCGEFLLRKTWNRLAPATYLNSLLVVYYSVREDQLTIIYIIFTLQTLR